jgi:hypothetical protein
MLFSKGLFFLVGEYLSLRDEAVRIPVFTEGFFGGGEHFLIFLSVVLLLPGSLLLFDFILKI